MNIVRQKKKNSGYDDTFFHSKVIPSWECRDCNKSSGTPYAQKETKYEDNQNV